MKPTVGRIVHYYDAEGKGPIAAIITRVEGDRVSITTFAPPACMGHCVGMQDIGYSEVPQPNRWTWPPQEPRTVPNQPIAGPQCGEKGEA